MIQPGATVAFSYPVSTLVGVPPEYRRRRLIVQRVRDLWADPITPEEFFRRPFVRRSRWLVWGRDVDRGTMRQFYLGSTREYPAPGLLGVGLYDPDSRQIVRRLPRTFADTRRDRQLLAESLARWCDHDTGRLRIGVFADDLAVVGRRRRRVPRFCVSRSAG